MDKPSKYDMATLVLLRDSGALSIISDIISSQIPQYDLFTVPKDQEEIFERERAFGAVQVLQELPSTLTREINNQISSYGRE